MYKFSGLLIGNKYDNFLIIFLTGFLLSRVDIKEISFSFFFAFSKEKECVGGRKKVFRRVLGGGGVGKKWQRRRIFFFFFIFTVVPLASEKCL